MNKIELLAPAGNLETNIAILYGADAVYIAVTSLVAFACK